MKPKRTQYLIFSALLTALVCISSLFTIPTPIGIPFTLQTFFICLCGYLLGIKYGAFSVAAYITLGIIGLPVFSGGHGGIHVILFGYGGGFIWGFIPLVLLCGLGSSAVWKRNVRIICILFGILGILVCHILGIIQFSSITTIGFVESVIVVSLPYILKDILSVAAAYYINILIKKRILGYFNFMT